MPHFLFRKPKTFSINFSEIEDDASSETPFWEIQRNEALDIITRFYSSWQALWEATRRSIGDLGLSEEGLRRLIYYENEQKKTVINLLAEMLVAWEKDDQIDFSASVLCLAKELRPSLTHFETTESESFALTPDQLERLKVYTNNEAKSLKTTIEDLQRLSWHKFEFGDKVLTVPIAESLIKEKLSIPSLDFIDFACEPEFNAHGFYPALLQESTEFGF